MRYTSARQSLFGLLLVTLLVAGLSACVDSEPDNDEEVDASLTNSATSQNLATQQSRDYQQPRETEAVRVTVPEGTAVHVTLSSELSSATSVVGDTLTATTTEAVVVGSRVAIPEGSTIHGRVTGVSAGTKGLDVSEKGGVVAITFDEVTTPRGDSTAMSASLSSIAKSGKKTAGIIGGSAAGGAVLGKILGGSTKDAAVGAVVGGGIGTGIAAGTKGKELVIPAGTHLEITLDRPLTIADRT